MIGTMPSEYIFMSANVIFTIGTFLLFRKVIADREVLYNFDFLGSIITLIALTVMLIGYWNLQMYIAMTLSLPTWFFWFFVVIYSQDRNESLEI